MEPQFIPPSNVGTVKDILHFARCLGITPERERELDTIAKQVHEQTSPFRGGFMTTVQTLENKAANYNEMLYLVYILAGCNSLLTIRNIIVSSPITELLEFVNQK